MFACIGLSRENLVDKWMQFQEMPRSDLNLKDKGSKVLKAKEQSHQLVLRDQREAVKGHQALQEMKTDHRPVPTPLMPDNTLVKYASFTYQLQSSDQSGEVFKGKFTNESK